MTWETMAAAYLESRRRAGAAAQTLAIGERWLRFFARACRAAGAARPQDVRAAHVAEFCRQLRGEPGPRGGIYAAASVDQALRVVRSFFRWGVAQRCLLVDAAEHLELRRPPRPVHGRLLSAEAVAAMLGTPDGATACGIRDRAILETFYGAGLRLGECAGLDVGDVDLAARRLVVRQGKGGRQRLLPVGEALAKALARYLREARPAYLRGPDEPALFLSYLGIRLSRASLQAAVARAARRAGLGFRVGPHALRHACATHMLEGGAGLLEIGALLGHASVKSTELYTHLCPLEVQREHARTHPRAGRRPRRERPFP